MDEILKLIFGHFDANVARNGSWEGVFINWIVTDNFTTVVLRAQAWKNDYEINLRGVTVKLTNSENHSSA